MNSLGILSIHHPDIPCDHISPTWISKTKVKCNPNSLPFSSLPCSVLRASPNACARLRWCLEDKAKWSPLSQCLCWPSYKSLSTTRASSPERLNLSCRLLLFGRLNKPSNNELGEVRIKSRIKIGKNRSTSPLLEQLPFSSRPVPLAWLSKQFFLALADAKKHPKKRLTSSTKPCEVLKKLLYVLYIILYHLSWVFIFFVCDKSSYFISVLFGTF